MKQSLSWIDPADLHRDLRDLAPVTPGNPLAQLASRPEVAPGPVQPARAAAVDTLVTAGATLFEPPAGTVQARLEAFLEWVGRRLETEEVFLAGQEGLCLAPAAVAPALVVASTWAVNAWEKAREALGLQGGGTAVFDNFGGKILVLVVEEGRWGMRGLGAILTSRPKPSVLFEIRLSLQSLIHSIETY